MASTGENDLLIATYIFNLSFEYLSPYLYLCVVQLFTADDGDLVSLKYIP